MQIITYYFVQINTPLFLKKPLNLSYLYQKNQFVGTQSSLFQAKPTTKEKELAKKVKMENIYMEFIKSQIN